MGPQVPKLQFTVIDCSGQDSEHPVAALLSNTPESTGWWTSRGCSWPQEVTLQLEGLARVQQFHVLSHEYLIASKVELHVGVPGAAGEVDWKRLGSFSFDSNERSRLQSRELKSVTVNVRALLVRIVLDRCHKNALNVHSQAGIMGVSLSGTLESPQPYPLPHLAPNQAPQPAPASPAGSSSVASEPGAAAAAAFVNGVRVDAKTGARLADLERLKAAAVAAEDYDEAKRLKQALDSLRGLAARLSELEDRKREAVEAEDYDAAKALKADIERLRRSGDSHAAQQPILAQHHQNGGGSAHARLNGGGQENPGLRNQDYGPSSTSQAAAAKRLSPRQPSNGDEVPASPLGRLSTADVEASRRLSGTPSQAYDERPAVARGTYFDPDADGEEEPDLATGPSESTQLLARGPRSSSIAGPGRRSVSEPALVAADDTAGSTPEGFPPDLPRPEPLPASKAKDAGDLTGVLEEHVVRCLYSTNWQLREAGLQFVAARLAGQDVAPEAKRDLAQAIQHTLKLLLGDKVAAVYLAGLSLIRTVVGPPPVLEKRDCASLIADLLPILIEKAGDNQGKVQAGSVDCLLHLAAVRDAGLAGQAQHFLKPEKAAQWKRVLARLQLLEGLVPVFGVGKAEGFPLEPLMKWVGEAFGNSNADVRQAAIRVTLLAHAKVGTAAVSKQLPKGINASIRKQLDAAFAAASAASPAASSGSAQQRKGRPASPPVPALAKRMSNAHAGEAAPVSPQPPRASAAAARAAVAKSAPAAAAAPVIVQAHAEYSMVAAFPPETPLPRMEEAGPEALPASGGFQDQEEAYYAAELAQREALLGPEHPGLADALSNLAILHNQRGDYGRAQPLYERALAIYERAYGPENADVAHTLTDLAVLHLEQGHEELGRPLLERALVIQEAALGPDHPDVRAIRDVLLGDDTEEELG